MIIRSFDATDTHRSTHRVQEGILKGVWSGETRSDSPELVSKDAE